MTTFSDKTLEILVDNRLADSKAFYDAHKPEIDMYVRQPFYRLIEAVAPTLQAADPLIICEPKRMLSRVRRDTRFSKDKSLYRDTAWCFWGRDKRHFPGAPEFFFELRPEYVWWGCGLYFAEPSYASAYRQMILDREPSFLAAKAAIDAQDRFKFTEGDAYKRTKYPNEPAHIREWLDRKSIYIAHKENDPSIAFGDGLADMLAAEFKTLLTYHAFLINVYDRAR